MPRMSTAPLQPGRPRAEQVLGAPDPERDVLDHQHQREGREQLVQLGRAVEPPQERDLDQRADAPTTSAAASTPPQKPGAPASSPVMMP